MLFAEVAVVEARALARIQTTAVCLKPWNSCHGFCGVSSGSQPATDATSEWNADPLQVRALEACESH